MADQMLVRRIYPDGAAEYYAGPSEIALQALIGAAFVYGQQFFYCLFETIKNGELMVTLERAAFDSRGEWLYCSAFKAVGDAARLLKAFHDRFLRSAPGQRQRLGVMLVQGIMEDEDLDAGLAVKDLGKLFEAIAASRESLVNLRFFLPLGV